MITLDFLQLAGIVGASSGAGFVAARTSVSVVRHELHRQLRTDSLTGLGNRLALTDEIRRTGRRPGWVAGLLLLDLDGFKQLNDNHGHETADQVLVEVGRRLAAQARDGELAIRLHGDEFAFWLGAFRCTDVNLRAARRRRNELAAALARPMTVDGTELQTSASIGLAVLPAAALEESELLRLADSAMYQNKNRHTSSVHSGRRRLRDAQPAGLEVF